MALATAGSCALVARPGPRARADIGALPAARPTVSAPAPAPSAPPPARIRISRIALSDPLVGLGVQQDGHLAAPQDPAQVGWWSDGPRPGDPGAAIVVGHVDSLTGPAAFYQVSSLRPGDPITIDRTDGSHVTFTVKALRQYDKDAFPDAEVYAPAGPPSLRLITCGGPYDHEHGGYRDNVVVYAALAAPRPPTVPTRSGN
ncbi:class F sortase [Streptomyces sp. NBC_01477]|uniref:class F sortase n=1 Tax=Streptomyces sp. NBC_01477 TaxID=2976015 RepID=UPI002E334DFA|nr:class F sortase [Streptomyces sp. NBC_01477]